MVIAILLTLWLCIAVCIMVLCLKAKKGRLMLKTLWRSPKVKIAAILPVVLIAATVAALLFQPERSTTHHDSRTLFHDYSRILVEELANQGAITIDTNCSLSAPQPELAYMLPAIVGVYHSIVNKPTTARLVQLDDTLRLSFDGYKQFKNRTINIMKGVHKRLGGRYILNMTSQGENHELAIAYKGNPWSNEQLCALPATEAGIRDSIDAALLMSIIRHISDFDFNYEASNREKGLLALDSGEGLEQIFIGAKKLKAALDTAKTTEDAVATFYPIHDMQTMHSEWRKSPLKSSWVDEVLKDVQYYKANGLK